MENACCQALEVSHVGRIATQQNKLVAAQTRDYVIRPRDCSQPCGNLLQQRVAGLMAEGVVDEFKMVQVDEQDGESVARCAGRCYRFVQSFAEAAAVRQIRQRVVAREVPDVLVGQLAVGDVTSDTHDTYDVVGSVPIGHLAGGIEPGGATCPIQD